MFTPPTSWSRPFLGVFSICLLIALGLAPDGAFAAQRGRRQNPQQMKKMKEQMEWMQQEMLRYQNETAAVQQQLITRFDENGNGKLEAAEKSKFNKFMSDVQKGKEANPFAEIAPPGQGPKLDATKKKK